VSGRRRVLIVQRTMQPPGGGQSIAAWMIEALKDRHDVTVCTAAPVDFEAVNRFFGTAIRPAEVTIVRAPSALVRLLEPIPLRLALLKDALFWRHVGSITSGAHDVLISGNNEADFGRPGIQYIHYPWTLRPRPDRRWYHLAPLVAPYYGVCDRLARFSTEGARLNLCLVNSDWTGALVRRQYGVATRTVYPPVMSSVAAVPWEKRENGFLCIGRLTREKQIERVIDIVDRVRESVPDVRLHIVGTVDAPAYARRIRRQVSARAAWITLHENLSRGELLRLMASQRYGIHGMRQEHFGIAIAEMASAGVVVFVPDDGGQVEIVGGDERVLYRTPDDAVRKIRRVLGDTAEQERLSAALAARRELFSTDRFVRSIREIVATFPRSAG
jgi:glycosyltransferase involved in cell wall biosynthesis